MELDLKMKFEYRIVLLYLIIGMSWIKFSDKTVSFFVEDVDLLTTIQTYKGFFFVALTGSLSFLFLKKHLTKLRVIEFELEKNKVNLQMAMENRTIELDAAIKKLELVNNKLLFQNAIINSQNKELKESLYNLKNTKNQLCQVDKMASLGILTAGVAHEINNPLNFILGGVTCLEKYCQAKKCNDDKVKMFIKGIHTGVDRVSAIVKGLNEMSRTNDSLSETCDIHDIIENCLLIVSSHLKHRIKIVKDYSNNEVVVLGNIGQLHQVFLNILINASQAIKNEGVISITTKVRNNKVQIQILDDGCGVEKNILPNIIDPFFTTKEPGTGTGLGLSITYNVIQSHKGTLSFTSELNKWTKVVIVLPAK
ncbi:MAG: hypothetical protein COB81_02575 [Flavobacteriaceae bacterium]|nr:MAG: hypothetical protein COB81_02575 [Flavobacteriaceae bacterium]